MGKEFEGPEPTLKVTDPAIFRYGASKRTDVSFSQMLKRQMTSRELRRKAERQARRRKKKGKM